MRGEDSWDFHQYGFEVVAAPWLERGTPTDDHHPPHFRFDRAYRFEDHDEGDISTYAELEAIDMRQK